MQQAYILKRTKACHHHQKCAQEKEPPVTESPEEIIISRGTTYSLRNGIFSRELSPITVISEIYNHLPTKKFVVGIQKQCEWILSYPLNL